MYTQHCLMDYVIYFPLVPALTVENILVALRGIEWRWDDIGRRLCVPWATRKEIRIQHSTVSDRLRAVLLYALTLHPRSSWRCVINALHWTWNHQVAELIQDYSEPVTGIYTYQRPTVVTCSMRYSIGR